MNQKYLDFADDVKKLSLKNKGKRKTFFLKHSDNHPQSILDIRVENYSEAKELFKVVFGNNYDESNFEREEGFVNDKPVFIHFVIHES